MLTYVGRGSVYPRGSIHSFSQLPGCLLTESSVDPILSNLPEVRLFPLRIFLSVIAKWVLLASIWDIFVRPSQCQITQWQRLRHLLCLHPHTFFLWSVHFPLLYKKPPASKSQSLSLFPWSTQPMILLLILFLLSKAFFFFFKVSTFYWVLEVQHLKFTLNTSLSLSLGHPDQFTYKIFSKIICILPELPIFSWEP